MDVIRSVGCPGGVRVKVYGEYSGLGSLQEVEDYDTVGGELGVVMGLPDIDRGFGLDAWKVRRVKRIPEFTFIAELAPERLVGGPAGGVE